MGIHLSHSNQTYSLKPKIVFFYVPLVLFLIPSSAYMIFEANSAIDFNNSFYINVTAISNFFTVSLTIMNMPTILNVIVRLEKIIQKSTENTLKPHLRPICMKIQLNYFTSPFFSEINDPTANAKYHYMHEKIERASKLYYFTVTRYNTPIFYLSSLMSTVINYFVFDLGDESYSLPFALLLPFNWKTPIGFSVFLAFEAFILSTIGLSCVPLISFTAGSCWLVNAFIKDITNDLINFKAKKKRDAQLKAKAHLYKVIKDFADVKQLSEF